MFSNRTTTRSTQEIARDFGALVEKGKALLGELAENRPVAANLRAVMDEVSEKFIEFQSSASKAAQQGAKEGASTRVKRTVRCAITHGLRWPQASSWAC